MCEQFCQFACNNDWSNAEICPPICFLKPLPCYFDLSLILFEGFNTQFQYTYLAAPFRHLAATMSGEIERTNHAIISRTPFYFFRVVIFPSF